MKSNVLRFKNDQVSTATRNCNRENICDNNLDMKTFVYTHKKELKWLASEWFRSG